jgi:transposase-like protein
MSKRSSLDELFKGRHFLAEVIVVSVRWYLEYKLSSRVTLDGYAASHRAVREFSEDSRGAADHDPLVQVFE